MIYHLQIILIKFFFEKLVQAKIIFNFINMLKIKFFLYNIYFNILIYYYIFIFYIYFIYK